MKPHSQCEKPQGLEHGDPRLYDAVVSDMRLRGARGSDDEDPRVDRGYDARPDRSENRVNEHINRRQFLQITAGTAAAAAAGATIATADTRSVAVVVDPTDAVASSPAGRWAADELVRALGERGVTARVYARAAEAPAAAA